MNVYKIHNSVMNIVKERKVLKKQSVTRELKGVFLIIGICLVVVEVGNIFALVEFANNDRQTGIENDRFWYYSGHYLNFKLYLLPGTIIIITTVICGIYFYLKSPFKLEEKKDYMNLKWLSHHYYELGMSLQDIANDQGVSMITVKIWVNKLDAALVDVGAKEY